MFAIHVGGSYLVVMFSRLWPLTFFEWYLSFSFKNRVFFITLYNNITDNKINFMFSVQFTNFTKRGNKHWIFVEVSRHKPSFSVLN